MSTKHILMTTVTQASRLREKVCSLSVSLENSPRTRDGCGTYPKYEAYKDSGVEWLGEVPDNWKIIKLGDLLSPVSEKNHPELSLLSITRELGVIERDVEDQDSNHNFIPDDLSGYKVLKRGQFGMNKMKAWQGSYGVSSYTGIVSPAYFIFNFTKEVHPSFFNTAIRSKLYVSFFGSASDGVRIGQWDLSKTRMKAIPFVLPSYKEQTAIANFLDEKTAKIDETIRIKEKQIEFIKERKQILIQNAVTKGLDPNAPMQDSGIDWIGEIPAHWQVPKFKRCCSVIKDGLHQTPPKHDVGINFISTQHVRNRKIAISNCSFISPRDYLKGHPRIKPEVGDVLITLVGSIGFSALVESKHILLSFTRHVGYVRCNELLDQEYLINYTESQSFSNFIEKNVSQTAQPSIYLSSLAEHKLPIPPFDEQKSIVDYLDERTLTINHAINLQLHQIDRLREYKATLINSAVTGKIKVVN